MIRRLQKRLWTEEDGQDLTEYALLLSMICLISVMAVKTFALSVSNAYSQASDCVVTATVNNRSGASLSATTGPSIHTESPSEHEKDSQDIVTSNTPITSKKPQ